MAKPRIPRRPGRLTGLFSRLRAEHVLFFILISIQGPLWFGEGGWLDVWSLADQVSNQGGRLEALEQEMFSLEAEVEDLESGTLVIEERARSDLGLIGPEEEFVQFSGSGQKAAPASPGSAQDPARLPPDPRLDP